MMRKKIYNIIGNNKDYSIMSKFYDILNIVVILLSIIPIMFSTKNSVFSSIEFFSVSFFIVDYFLRFITADYKLNKGRIKSFVIYPFTPMAIIDFLAIIPIFLEINPAFKVLKVLRLFRAFRVLKLGRYSKSVMLILKVLKKEKNVLLAIFGMAIAL